MKKNKIYSIVKEQKKRIANFFEGKGFYVMLIMAIAVFGIISAVVTTKKVKTPKPDFDIGKIISEDSLDNKLFDSNDKEIQSSIEDDEKNKTNKNETEDMAYQTVSKKIGNKKEDSKESTPQENLPGDNQKTMQNFILPVFGEVILDYAMETLVYWNTLDEWRVHKGINISSDLGTVVKVVADGTVKDVKYDEGFGMTIVVDHGNGINTVYSNLSEGVMVLPNQLVKQGDVIGSVGDTSLYCSIEPPHLHFEVIRDGKHMDPKKYLPQSFNN